ncbi:MAG: sigma-70 family RNA polymerase sigma factor, partial [Deltaproteobacteria bacterium]|nr:sigma-70 family RNA polymerase sigma factor [Deltaproteobacteria bacterium]
FKTISRFPLLSEEEERIKAKRIKENEKECKDLMIQWRDLFENEFLGMFSAMHKKEVRKTLQQLSGSFNLFDNLAKLERERKKVNRTLKRRNCSFKTKEGLHEGLYEVEAEISKCIAKISLSKTTNNLAIRKLKKIPHNKNNTNKRQSIEQKLGIILGKADELSKDIKEMKNEFVHANQRLVISIAKKYGHHGLTLPDLIQEGNLGLIRAIDTFDYRKGHRFITYAVWWIRQTIVRALDCKSRTIRKPVHMNDQMKNIVKASNRLLQEYKREPTLEEIAEETNISLESIVKAVQSFRDVKSMSTLIDEHGERVITPAFNHKNNPVLENVISYNLSQIIDVVLSDLTTQEKEMIKLRFGIGVSHDHTLEEIGGNFHLSRERVRQILEVALNKLRNPKRMVLLKDFIDCK